MKLVFSLVVDCVNWAEFITKESSKQMPLGLILLSSTAAHKQYKT